MDFDMDIDMDNLDDLPDLSLNPSQMSEASDAPSLLREDSNIVSPTGRKGALRTLSNVKEEEEDSEEEKHEEPALMAGLQLPAWPPMQWGFNLGALEGLEDFEDGMDIDDEVMGLPQLSL